MGPVLYLLSSFVARVEDLARYYANQPLPKYLSREDVAALEPQIVKTCSALFFKTLQEVVVCPIDDQTIEELIWPEIKTALATPETLVREGHLIRPGCKFTTAEGLNANSVMTFVMQATHYTQNSYFIHLRLIEVITSVFLQCPSVQLNALLSVRSGVPGLASEIAKKCEEVFLEVVQKTAHDLKSLAPTRENLIFGAQIHNNRHLIKTALATPEKWVGTTCPLSMKWDFHPIQEPNIIRIEINYGIDATQLTSDTYSIRWRVLAVIKHIAHQNFEALLAV